MTVKKAVRRQSRTIKEVTLPFDAEDVRLVGEGRHEPDWFFDQRIAAWELYQSMPMPTVKDEAWRRTDLRKIPAGKLTYRHHTREQDRTDVAPVSTESGYAATLAFNPDQTPLVTRGEMLSREGVIVETLSEAAQEHGSLLRPYLGQLVPPGDGKFAALTAAMGIDGFFVFIPEDVHLELPIHASTFLEGDGLFYAARIVVVVQKGASATIIHEVASSSMQDILYSSTVELFVEDDGCLHFIEVQELGDQTWNMTHERAKVGSDGACDWVLAVAGSRLTKSFLDLDLRGRGSEGRMSGFFLAEGNQHLDLDTQQNHFAPDTSSDLLFKGTLRDRSRSVWQGMIYVAPGAQKTDGYQANRNLLLSKEARADSIPGLEILADDVRCTHGATAGQLDEEPIYYLMSRGLPREEAERLIVNGFFNEVLKRIQFEAIRNRFVDMIDGKL